MSHCARDIGTIQSGGRSLSNHARSRTGLPPSSRRDGATRATGPSKHCSTKWSSNTWTHSSPISVSAMPRCPGLCAMSSRRSYAADDSNMGS
jgi:hypothetical protein